MDCYWDNFKDLGVLCISDTKPFSYLGHSPCPLPTLLPFLMLVILMEIAYGGNKISCSYIRVSAGRCKLRSVVSLATI